MLSIDNSFKKVWSKGTVRNRGINGEKVGSRKYCLFVCI